MKGTKTVSIKSELRKEGIEVIEKIHPLNVNYIATTITKRLITNFPEHHFNYNELFAKIRGLNMYIAKMPNGIAAKYGGGGHLQASGATVKGMDVIPHIIKDLEKVLNGEKI